MNKQIKQHYKMYKSGRHWVCAAITVVTVGIGAGFSSTQNAAAAGDDGAADQAGQVTDNSTASNQVILGNHSDANTPEQPTSDADSEEKGTVDAGATQQASQPIVPAPAEENATPTQPAQTSQTNQGTQASLPVSSPEPSPEPEPATGTAPANSAVASAVANAATNTNAEPTTSGTPASTGSVTIGGVTYTDPVVVEFERELTILANKLQSGAATPATFDNLPHVAADPANITTSNYTTEFSVKHSQPDVQNETGSQLVMDFADSYLPDILSGNLAWATSDFESNYNVNDDVHRAYQGTASDIWASRYMYNLILDKYKAVTPDTPVAYKNVQVLAKLFGTLGQNSLTRISPTWIVVATMGTNIGQPLRVLPVMPDHNPQFNLDQAKMNLEPMTSGESQVTTIRMDMAIPDADVNYQVVGGLVLPSMTDDFVEFSIAKDHQSGHVLLVGKDGTLNAIQTISVAAPTLSLGTLVSNPNSKLTSTNVSFTTDQNTRPSIIIDDYDLNSTVNDSHPTTSNLISFTEPTEYTEQLAPVLVYYYVLNVDGTTTAVNTTQLAYVTGSPNNGMGDDYAAAVSLAAEVRDQFLVDHPDYVLYKDIDDYGVKPSVVPSMRQYEDSQWLIGSETAYAANHTLSNGQGGKKAVVLGDQVMAQLAGQPGISDVLLASGYQTFDQMGKVGYTLQRVAELDANGQPMTVDGAVQETAWKLIAPATSPQSVVDPNEVELGTLKLPTPVTDAATGQVIDADQVRATGLLMGGHNVIFRFSVITAGGYSYGMQPNNDPARPLEVQPTVYPMPSNDYPENGIVPELAQVETPNAKPMQPTEPGNPTQPTQPTEPHHPTQPTEPHHPTQPTEPHHPSQPTQPHHPTQPTQPTQPRHPSQPTQPRKPRTPGHPGLPNTDGHFPGQPGTPGHPGLPNTLTPNQPTQPTWLTRAQLQGGLPQTGDSRAKRAQTTGGILMGLFSLLGLSTLGYRRKRNRDRD